MAASKENKSKKNRMLIFAGVIGAVLLYFYYKGKATAAGSAVSGSSLLPSNVSLGYNTPSTTYGTAGANTSTPRTTAAAGHSAATMKRLNSIEAALSQLIKQSRTTNSGTGILPTNKGTGNAATKRSSVNTVSVNGQQYQLAAAGAKSKSNPALVTATNKTKGYHSFTFASHGGGQGLITVTATKSQSAKTSHGLFGQGVKDAGGVYVHHKWYSAQQYAANGYKEKGIAQSVKPKYKPAAAKPKSKPNAKAKRAAATGGGIHRQAFAM